MEDDYGFGDVATPAQKSDERLDWMKAFIDADDRLYALRERRGEIDHEMKRATEQRDKARAQLLDVLGGRNMAAVD